MISAEIFRNDTGLHRSIHLHTDKISFAFGIYRWPWFRRWGFYNTTIAQIFDEVGIVGWLANVKNIERDGYRIINIRLLCVAVGVRWEVMPA
jgi:hypothetical protein